MSSEKERKKAKMSDAEKIKRMIEQGYINALTQVLKTLMKEEERRNHN